MKVRNIYTLALIFGFLFSMNLLSQETTVEKKDSKPVRKPFNANQLIDLQTVIQPKANSLELLIHHRFGIMKNGTSDLFGIYGPSNIRLGLNYGITERLMIGIGTEKEGKLQDIQWKYAVLRQTKSNSIPVSLSYYGNMAIDARNKSFFGTEEATFTTRMSYYHQIIISRKFNKEFSLLFAPGLAHINRVDAARQNNVLALALGGKYTITKKITLIGEYSHPFYLKEKQTSQVLPESNLALGLEITTSTHVFQVTFSQYRGIIPQYNTIFNTNALDDGGWVLGFNINVKF